MLATSLTLGQHQPNIGSMARAYWDTSTLLLCTGVLISVQKNKTKKHKTIIVLNHEIFQKYPDRVENMLFMVPRFI